MIKLYLDGCSLTWGQGVAKEYQLATLLDKTSGYQVINESRPGKSNLAIAYDAYQHTSPEIYVLGWTFSSRFYLKHNQEHLDFFAGWHGQSDFSSNELDRAFKENYQFFYSVFGPPFSDELSDMLIDTTIDSLKRRAKKVVAFSWEHRNTRNKLLYPFIGPSMRLHDGHLNENGIKYLYQLIVNEISNE